MHEQGFVCKKKPKNNRDYHSDKRVKSFRGSASWANARSRALDRDYHLCRMCYDGTYGDYRKSYGLNQRLEVHHIVPLSIAFERRAELENLITLCPVHHNMCDRGEVPEGYLIDLAKSPPVF